MTVSYKWILEFAKLIKALGTIIGFFALVYIAAANWLSDTALGKYIASTGDALIATERLSNTYVYYEINENSDLILTEDGRFSPIDGTLPSPYAELAPGDVLRAASTVRIRPEPTKNAPIVGTLKGNTCISILRADWELDPSEFKEATSGGWLNVNLVSCE